MKVYVFYSAHFSLGRWSLPVSAQSKAWTKQIILFNHVVENCVMTPVQRGCFKHAIPFPVNTYVHYASLTWHQEIPLVIQDLVEGLYSVFSLR